MRDIVCSIGGEAGFDSAVAATADEFKNAFQKNAADVVVLDLQMPDTDGVQLLRFLADGATDAGVILMSGMDRRTIASAEQYGKSRGLRMLGTLQKPFTPEELAEVFARAKAMTQILTGDDLRTAIERDQLSVLYQPTIQRFADGSWDVTAMEALVRWNHPERGVLKPDQFIEMSETEGLGRAVTDFVMQRGIEQLKGWHATRLNLGLRVNVPAILVADVDFPDRLEALLRQQEIDPSALTVEITETAMLDRHPDTFDILTRMRLKNINLAIDDFGIGYSSLTQLFDMPFNEMKIDKSLVLRTPQSREAKIMVRVLVDLAHKLDLTVCAEGVETEETLDFLTSVGCDSAQGFLVSAPIEAEAVPDVVYGWEGLQRRRRAAG
jgi:EAL domain-containing protein (putative c-di-GMP-specific phosphodiesterase class I)